jgi:hypothetical protein
LVPTVQETLEILGAARTQVSSVGLFLDADWTISPADTFSRLKTSLQAIGLPAAGAPGTIAPTEVRTGIFIFPDNQAAGILESLLDECAAKVYPGLRDEARRFIAGVDRADLTKEDLAEISKPSGETKVTVGCIANYLRPGRAIQNSIEDNRRLCADTLTLTKTRNIREFLRDLLDLQ